MAVERLRGDAGVHHPRVLGQAPSPEHGLNKWYGKAAHNVKVEVPASGAAALTHFNCAPFVDALEGLVCQVEIDPYSDLEHFLNECAILAGALPAAIRLALRRFARWGNVDGVLVLTGLPIERNLPATPTAQLQALRGRRGVSEILISMVAAVLGAELVAYVQHLGGAIFQGVLPTLREEYVQSSSGSRNSLLAHTEDAFHPRRPDFLFLYCERPDHERQARTTFIGARHLVSLLDEPMLQILRQPLFRTGIDFSFGGPDLPADAGLITPVLLGSEADPLLIYDEDLMVGLTREAADALRHLASTINANYRGEILVEGSLIVIDNWRAAHGRSAFTPRYDGRDRWLRRAYAVRDLLRSAADRPGNGRIICTQFP